MSEQNNPKVKILVSCHKEVPLPDSEIYVPVQVGASGKPSLKGMQPDNLGENISDRNFSFCELTAQYWAWKNLDADFYGLCHYRRYFCFDGLDHPANDHLQIEEDALSGYTFRDYRINDDVLTRQFLNGTDVVTPPYWNVNQAPTPDGVKPTVQEHMIAFGLYTNEDVDLLKSIIQEKHPEYIESFDRYMSGNKYLGYNCYIMRKDLFNRFCEFEFDVLLEFDKRFDYLNMTSTRKRICGYFGEVLYSVFIEKIAQEGTAKIKQAPLVFFMDTSNYYEKKHCDSAKLKAKGKQSCDAVRIVWRYRDRSVSAFEVCVESLIRQLNSNTNYELIVLHEIDFVLDAFRNILPFLPSNLSISYAHWASLPILDQVPSLNLKDLDLVHPLLLSWFEETPFLWVDGLAIFQADPKEVIDSSDRYAFYCLRNVLLHRELNKPLTKHFLGDYGVSPKKDNILDTTIMVVNSDLARREYEVGDICALLERLRKEKRAIQPTREIGKIPNKKKKTPIAPGYLLENQAFRACFLNEIGVADLPFNTVSHAVDYADTASWLNEDWSKEWRLASSPSIIYLEYGKPPILNANQRFGSIFWQLARQLKCYEVLLGEELEPEEASFKSALFPDGSRRKKVLKKILRR